MIFRYCCALGSLIMSSNSFVIGIIELRGVLSSCVTEEKNMDLTLYEIDSSSLILVMSFMNTVDMVAVKMLLMRHFNHNVRSQITKDIFRDN